MREIFREGRGKICRPSGVPRCNTLNFILYSGGNTAKNRTLHAALEGLVSARRRRADGRSITYVPFAAAGSDAFYRRFVRRYRPYGFKNFHHFPIDVPFTPDALEKALASDAIYLAGGNTFYFLHHLRRCGLLTRFRDYAAAGGVIAGLSAGAIILTPNIGLAGYPPFDCDRNDIGLKDLRALSLVPFEFFPHYHGRAPLRAALLDYSKRSLNPLVGVADGGGVVVEDGRLEFVGRTELFMGGAHGRLSV